MATRGMPVTSHPERRYMAKMRVGDGCWEWTGAMGGDDGYGQVWVVAERRTRPAHRVIYELLVGPIPDGLELDHLCRNHRCVRPDHLEPVTHAENMRRGFNFQSTKTHCPRGHEYTSENIRANAAGKRGCKVCHRDRERARRARRANLGHA